MKKAVKYVYKINPLAVHWKHHSCPQCGTKLVVKHISKVVNSKSPEAKEYDFSLGDTFLVGDVEFRTPYYSCNVCGHTVSVPEMSNLARMKKKKKKKS